jgi:hypothetical protein
VNELPLYRVREDVQYVSHDRAGREHRFFFPAATARPESEDEQFVLDHVLVPAGLAECIVNPNQES